MEPNINPVNSGLVKQGTYSLSIYLSRLHCSLDMLQLSGLTHFVRPNTWKTKTSTTCLADQIKRLVKFQLFSSTRFGFRVNQSFRRPQFCCFTLYLQQTGYGIIHDRNLLDIKSSPSPTVRSWIQYGQNINEQMSSLSFNVLINSTWKLKTLAILRQGCRSWLKPQCVFYIVYSPEFQYSYLSNQLVNIFLGGLNRSK